MLRHRVLIGAGVVVALAAALTLLAAGEQASLANGVIIYVDAGAIGTPDGESWATAFTDLQLALADADPGQQIWVATGVYTPTVEYGGSGDRYRSFQLVNEVAIYGGFAGGETTLEERDWASNVTILSGDIGIFDDYSDNSYHVFYHPDTAGLDNTALLDGFTITGGNANGSWPHDEGGGMFNDSSSPTLANCTFADNWASEGAGMYNWEASPVLTHCTFTGNQASSSGGGMYNMQSSPTLTDCSFESNSAEYDGGGMENYMSSSPTLTNCAFYNNEAGGYGGGMDSWNASSPGPVLTNCTFNGNTAADGGAMYNGSASPTLTNCILWGDTAEEPPYEIDGDAATVTYSDIQGGYPGVDNKDEDPLFVDASSGNLHLGPGSPCIDAGTNTVDLPPYDFEGDARIIDGDRDGTSTVDMGVDEVMLCVYLPLMLKNW